MFALLFHPISIFLCYLMPKSFFLKNSSCTIYLIAGRIRGVYTFLMGICPKVNVIARLEFELTYYDSVVHRFNHEDIPYFRL